MILATSPFLCVIIALREEENGETVSSAKRAQPYCPLPYLIEPGPLPLFVASKLFALIISSDKNETKPT